MLAARLSSLEVKVQTVSSFATISLSLANRFKFTTKLLNVNQLNRAGVCSQCLLSGGVRFWGVPNVLFI